MPGWIIQGVRGEGKSLAAVGMIKEYLLRGRPVATNLDLYLENFLPMDNSALCYRLPDHPRLEDFEMLPPAYDLSYKAEDMNGLLVLDELGTWLNSRSWNDKTRLKLLNWLFLSRKLHWDLILLAQDFAMIDSQVQSTLCDYLVQASRLDRQKIPYIAPLLELVGFNSFMPRIHRYHVFYGLSTAQPPIETWTFTGKEFYDGYDTNQRFRDGLEFVGSGLVDMRATYTYLPASYLTGYVHVKRLADQLDALKVRINFKGDKEFMAIRKNHNSSLAPKIKVILLSLALVGFLIWRYGLRDSSAPSVVGHAPVAVSVPVPVQQPATLQQQMDASSPSHAVQSSASPPVQPPLGNVKPVALETESFIDYLINRYRPRLSVSAFSVDKGFLGDIDFYDNYVLVERYPINHLHALGVVLIHKPYGADMVYKGKSYIVTAWKLPDSPDPVDTAQQLSSVGFASPGQDKEGVIN
jgi:hypothetical protein